MRKSHLNPKTAAIIVLFSAVMLAYGSSLMGEFIWDDYQLIVNNTLVKDWRHLPEIFGSELHRSTFTNYYRPLQSMSFMVDYTFFKLHPAGYHAVNLLLHFLVGVFMFLFLKDLTRNKFLSLFTALIFLVHPIHAAVVGYISGRADLLAALCILVSLVCYFKSPSSIQTKDAQDRKPDAFSKKAYYRLSMLFFCFALLSKEIAIMLPFALLGLKRLGYFRSKNTRPLWPFFGILLIYVFLRLTLLNFSSGHPFLCKEGFAIFEVNIFSRIGIFLKTFGIYLGSLFIPLGLHMERIICFERLHLFHIIGMLACLVLCFWVFRKTRVKRQTGKNLFFLSVFWFGVWLLPQSAFILPKIMADHFLYLPSIGIFLIAAMAVESVSSQRLKKGILVIVIGYLTLFSWFYNFQWRQESAFFAWTARHAPRSYKVHDCLADAYLKKKRPYEAIREYRLILDPDAKTLKEDYHLFTKGLLKEPLSEKKRELLATTLYNLGVVYRELGDTDKAQEAYECALRLNPRLERAFNNLALIHEKRGNPRQAELFYRRAMALKTDYLAPYNNLARLYAEKGDLKKAMALWQEALKIDPDYEAARKNISLLHELHRNRKKIPF